MFLHVPRTNVIKIELSFLKVELADAKTKSKIVKLGALRAHQTLRKQVPIVNNSLCPLSFHLGFTPSNVMLLENTAIQVLPEHEILLPAKGGRAIIEIVFTPKSRIPQFTEEVSVAKTEDVLAIRTHNSIFLFYTQVG